MVKSLSLLARGLKSSSETTPEWTRFANQFKRDIIVEINHIGGKLTQFNEGHFYVSGFFRTPNDLCYYFSTSDLRGEQDPQLLIRTAKDEKDYRGGQNNMVAWTHGMFSKLPTI
jgi:hypothetical protein